MGENRSGFAEIELNGCHRPVPTAQTPQTGRRTAVGVTKPRIWAAAVQRRDTPAPRPAQKRKGMLSWFLTPLINTLVHRLVLRAGEEVCRRQKILGRLSLTKFLLHRIRWLTHVNFLGAFFSRMPQLWKSRFLSNAQMQKYNFSSWERIMLKLVLHKYRYLFWWKIPWSISPT